MKLCNCGQTLHTLEQEEEHKNHGLRYEINGEEYRYISPSTKTEIICMPMDYFKGNYIKIQKVREAIEKFRDSCFYLNNGVYMPSFNEDCLQYQEKLLELFKELGL